MKYSINVDSFYKTLMTWLKTNQQSPQEIVSLENPNNWIYLKEFEFSQNITLLQNTHVSNTFFSFCDVWGSNLKPYIYYILFLPAELNSRGLPNTY